MTAPTESPWVLPGRKFGWMPTAFACLEPANRRQTYSEWCVTKGERRTSYESARVKRSSIAHSGAHSMSVVKQKAGRSAR